MNINFFDKLTIKRGEVFQIPGPVLKTPFSLLPMRESVNISPARLATDLMDNNMFYRDQNCVRTR